MLLSNLPLDEAVTSPANSVLGHVCVPNVFLMCSSCVPNVFLMSRELGAGFPGAHERLVWPCSECWRRSGVLATREQHVNNTLARSECWRRSGVLATR